MNNLLLSIIPVLGGLVTAWISSSAVWKQKETGIIDRISLELSNIKLSPFIIEICIARLLKCRSISYAILQHLLKLNNSVEILLISSTHRRLLEIFSFKEVEGTVYITFRRAFSSRFKRFMSCLICFLLVNYCCYIASGKMSELIISISVNDKISASINVLYLVISMTLSYFLAWQLYLVSSAKARIRRIKSLLKENYL